MIMVINATPIPGGKGTDDSAQCVGISNQQFDARVNRLVKPIELVKQKKDLGEVDTVYEGYRHVTEDTYKLIVDHGNYDGLIHYEIWHDTTNGKFENPARKTMVRSHFSGGQIITWELPGKTAKIPNTSCDGPWPGYGDPTKVFLSDEKI